MRCYMRLFSILTLALLATTLARAEQLVFTIDSAPMSYLHGVLQAYLDDSSIYVTGENTPANNGVSEMVSDYGFSADFSSFDSHQGNRWVFPAGAGVVVAGNMFFYPGVDPRNIFCFCGHAVPPWAGHQLFFCRFFLCNHRLRERITTTRFAAAADDLAD